jgi:hypothetical protein
MHREIPARARLLNFGSQFLGRGAATLPRLCCRYLQSN